MNILFIPSWYPNKSNPLSGIFFKEQAQALSKNGHCVVVMVVNVIGIFGYFRLWNKSLKIEFKFTNNLIEANFFAFNILPRKFFPKGRIISNNKNAYKLFRLIQNKVSFKPDIIHAHSIHYAGLSALHISKKLNIPYVLTEHSTGFERDLFLERERFFFRRVLLNANKIIAVGPGLKTQLERICPEKEILIIPNMIDTNFFTLDRRENMTFTFFCLASLENKKAIDNLIISFNKMNNKESKLVIGGEGPDEEKLKNLVFELGLVDRVNFIGMLNRQEVVNQLNKSNVFILVSRVETFGVVFIEALSCGVPIIASRSGGPDLIVNKENGILVEVNDVKATAEAMDYIFENINLYSARKIRENCINKYSETAVVNRLNIIYENIINKTK